jgi:hypothetical protein
VKEIKDLIKLEGCQIIEGSVKISLSNKFNPEDFDNLTFPTLKEIGGKFLRI